MHTSKRISTKRIVLTGLMAALTVVGSWIRVTIPLDIAGTSSFHLGNIFCALSGILLGPWYGGLAAGLGSAIYDIMLNPLYISECWITFLTKGLYGLAAGLVVMAGKKPWGYGKALLGTTVGAAVYAFVYLAKSFFYSGMLLHGLTVQAAWLTVIGRLPATVFNMVIAMICAPLLAIAIRKALQKSHLSI